MPIRKLGPAANRQLESNSSVTKRRDGSEQKRDATGKASNSNRNADGSYIVGKNRPPVHTHFQKGQSGNPKGSRKVQPDLEASVIALLDEPVVLNTSGVKKIRMTQGAALMRKTYEQGVKGNIRATKFLFDTYAKAKAGKAHAGVDEDALSTAEEQMLKALLAGFGSDSSEGDAS